MDVEKSDDATVSAESASVSPTKDLSGDESETDKFEDTATETGLCLSVCFFRLCLSQFSRPNLSVSCLSSVRRLRVFVPKSVFCQELTFLCFLNIDNISGLCYYYCSFFLTKWAA